jgi:hypothetical protein
MLSEKSDMCKPKKARSEIGFLWDGRTYLDPRYVPQIQRSKGARESILACESVMACV